MRNAFFFSVVLFGISCEETDKEGDDTDLISDTSEPGDIIVDTAEDSGQSTECGTTFVSSSPQAESDTFFYRDAIRIELSDLDETASISMRMATGEDIAGNMQQNGPELLFIPSQSLVPQTDYVIFLSYCSSDIVVEIPFRTSEFGLEVSGDISEKSYAFNFGTGRMDPPEFQASLNGMVENNIILSIKSQNGTRLSFHSGSSTANDTAQDYCAQTSGDFAPYDLQDGPEISIANTALPFRVKDQQLMLRDFSMKFTMAPDGSAFSHGYWSAEIDMREFAPLLNQASFDMCENYFPTFGVQCYPCSVDQEPRCITLSMFDIDAEAFDKVINCVDENQCHIECSNNTQDCVPLPEQICEQ